MPEAAFLKPADLVARWGHVIEIETLATWRFRGEGPPYVKVGARVMYPLEGVLQYEKKNTVPAA